MSNPTPIKRPRRDTEMEEVAERPPFMLMRDDYFTVYQRRRRRLVSGEAPEGVNDDRPMHAREWRAYQNRMNEEPAWERAERYRRMMQSNGYRSIRALARATGEVVGSGTEDAPWSVMAKLLPTIVKRLPGLTGAVKLAAFTSVEADGSARNGLTFNSASTAHSVAARPTRSAIH